MSYMPPFFKNKPLIFTVIAAAILVIIMIVTSGGRVSISGVEDLIGGVISPIQGTIYRMSTSVVEFFEGIINQKNLEKECLELKERVSQLEAENQRLNEIEKENLRLRELLGFVEAHSEFEPVGARVIGKNPGNWFNVFVINKGKKHGLEKDMAVVAEEGLVGRIIEAGANWSKVLSIIDSRSSVSGIIERTRDNGVVRGNNVIGNEDGLCRMFYLPLETDLIPGDKVLTSGLGGVFPKGILIGEIKEISRQKNELQKYAVIKPSVDFYRLEEVLVVKADFEYTDDMNVD